MPRARAAEAELQKAVREVAELRLRLLDAEKRLFAHEVWLENVTSQLNGTPGAEVKRQSEAERLIKNLGPAKPPSGDLWAQPPRPRKDAGVTP